VRAVAADVRVEVLTPDFKGEVAPLATVLAAGPDVFNHNLETVERLSRAVRPQGDYARSLAVLSYATTLRRTSHQIGDHGGLGETPAEVHAALGDLRAPACDLVTMGQYLQPSRRHLPVAEYVPPARFAEYATIARELGFRHVAQDRGAELVSCRARLRARLGGRGMMDFRESSGCRPMSSTSSVT